MFRLSSIGSRIWRLSPANNPSSHLLSIFRQLSMLWRKLDLYYDEDLLVSILGSSSPMLALLCLMKSEDSTLNCCWFPEDLESYFELDFLESICFSFFSFSKSSSIIDSFDFKGFIPQLLSPLNSFDFPFYYFFFALFCDFLAFIGLGTKFKFLLFCGDFYYNFKSFLVYSLLFTLIWIFLSLCGFLTDLESSMDWEFSSELGELPPRSGYYYYSTLFDFRFLQFLLNYWIALTIFYRNSMSAWSSSLPSYYSDKVASICFTPK